MAKDPTQGPVSTYDEFGNPIKANVDEPIVEAAEEVVAEDATTEETVEETVTDESNVEESEEEVESGEEVAPEQLEAEQAAMDAQDEIEASPEESEEPPETDASEEEAAEESDAPTEEIATSGEEPAQADVSVEGEPAADDVAQPVGEDPAEEIEKAELGDETEKMPKEEDDPVEEEEEFVTHEHEVKPPLTYNEAETMLMGTSFLKMREMAIADGIKPERSRVKVMRQLLDLWFPAPTSAPADDEPEMSVRIRRAKGLM